MAFGGNFGNNFGGQQVSIAEGAVGTTDNVTTSTIFTKNIVEAAISTGDTISRLFTAFRECIISIVVTDNVSVPINQDFYGTVVEEAG